MTNWKQTIVEAIKRKGPMQGRLADVFVQLADAERQRMGDDCVAGLIRSISTHKYARPFMASVVAELPKWFHPSRVTELARTCPFVAEHLRGAPHSPAPAQRELPFEAPTVLFLDYDGVLHRGGVYPTPGGRVVSEFGSAVQLLEFAGVLERLLLPYPSLKIVLSTSWVPKLGLPATIAYLPPSLRERVIGTTFPTAGDPVAWNRILRGHQVGGYAKAQGITRWLALDDLSCGFDEYRDRHVQPYENIGMGSLEIQDQLRQALCTLHYPVPAAPRQP